MESIGAYVAQDDPDAAWRLVSSTLERVGALSEFPFLGRVVPELGMEPYRELLIEPLRVIYLVEPERVTVLSVLHQARFLTPNDIR